MNIRLIYWCKVSLLIIQFKLNKHTLLMIKDGSSGDIVYVSPDIIHYFQNSIKPVTVMYHVSIKTVLSLIHTHTQIHTHPAIIKTYLHFVVPSNPILQTQPTPYIHDLEKQFLCMEI